LHILRMGVLCPNEVGYGSTGGATVDSVTTGPNADWVYTYDDYFMECFDAVSFGPNGEYGCLQGEDCAGVACTTNITKVDIFPSLPKYQAFCVQTASVLDTVPAVPTRAPISLTAPTSATYSATFEVRWSQVLTPADATGCFGFTPAIEVQCTSGGIIEFVDSIYDTMNCTAYNDEPDGVGYMTCLAVDASTTSNTLGVNEFISVQYVRLFV
jgi:hypothetical protein